MQLAGTKANTRRAPFPWYSKKPVLEPRKLAYFAIITVPINNSSILARFKPSQPLMMSSGTRDLPKNARKKTFFRPFSPETASQKKIWKSIRGVTWLTITCHCTYRQYPVPQVLITEKTRVFIRPLSPTKSLFFIHLFGCTPALRPGYTQKRFFFKYELFKEFIACFNIWLLIMTSNYMFESLVTMVTKQAGINCWKAPLPWEKNEQKQQNWMT